MSIKARIVFFGAVSGLIWSLAPGFLGELFYSTAETIAVLFASIITGISVSFTVHRPLMWSRRWVTLLLGVISLPVGGFFFGVLISVFDLVIDYATGEPRRLIAGGFNPLIIGLEYALMSVISLFAIVFFPSAVLTTFLLRRVILGGRIIELRAK